MSRDFDVLYEAPLRTEAFGEGESVVLAPSMDRELNGECASHRRANQRRVGIQTDAVPWLTGQSSCGSCFKPTYRPTRRSSI
jgi:hypothetical protein